MRGQRNPSQDANLSIYRKPGGYTVALITWRDSAWEIGAGDRVAIEAGGGAIHLRPSQGRSGFSVCEGYTGWVAVRFHMPAGTAATPSWPMRVLSHADGALVIAPVAPPPPESSLALLLAAWPRIVFENRRFVRPRDGADHPAKPAAVIDPAWPRYEDSAAAEAANLTGRLVIPATVVPRCGCLDVSGKRERWE